MSEASIQHAIRKAINLDGRCRLVRNSVGFIEGKCRRCGHVNHAPMRFGLGVGSPDLIGPLVTGVIFAIEAKRPGEPLSTDQVAWWRAARKWGVRGGRADSVEEAMTLLEDACPRTP